MLSAVVLAGAVAVGAGQLNDPVPADLRRAADAYDAAQAAGDRRALDRWLADDYLLIDGSGASENKPDLIKDFTDPAFHLRPYRVESPVERVWRDGAMLGGEVHLEGTSSGKTFNAHTRFVDVWRKRAGKWQVIFTQVTRFPPAS